MAEINPLYLKGLNFVYIREMTEVVDLAMGKEQVDKPLVFEV